MDLDIGHMLYQRAGLLQLLDNQRMSIALRTGGKWCVLFPSLGGCITLPRYKMHHVVQRELDLLVIKTKSGANTAVGMSQ